MYVYLFLCRRFDTKKILSWHKKHENPMKIDGILYVFRRALLIE